MLGEDEDGLATSEPADAFLVRRHRGTRLSGRLLGDCSGGRSALRNSFAQPCDQTALFRLGSYIRGGAGFLFGFTIGCLSGVLVVRMIPLDHLLGRFLSLEGIQCGVRVGMAGHPLEATRIA